MLNGVRHISISLPFVSILAPDVQPEDSRAEPAPPPQGPKVYLGKTCPRHPEANGTRRRRAATAGGACVRCLEERKRARQQHVTGANHEPKMRKRVSNR
jgi:hypothetical protein